MLFSSFSLFALLQHSVSFGLSEAFKLIIDVYAKVIDITIGQLLDPYIILLLDFFSDFFQIEFHFSHFWRYVFIVLQILFIRDAITAYEDGRKVLALFRLVIGISIAVLACVFMLLPETWNPVFSNIWIALTPLIALLFYDIIMYVITATFFFDSVRKDEKDRVLLRLGFVKIGIQKSVFRFLIIAIPTLILFVIPYFQNLDVPAGGIALMLIGGLINCSYWLYHAYRYAIRSKLQSEHILTPFMKSEAGRFGLSVLSVAYWLGMFCLINAGARILKL